MAKIKKLLLIALGIRLFLVFISGYHPDILNHVDWGIKFWEYGPKAFYEQIFWGVSWPNQPLGTMYLFGLVAKIYQFIFGFLFSLNQKIALFPSFIFPFLESKFHIILLKLPFILADLGLGYLIYQFVLRITKKKKAALLGTSLFLFNPALIYNSAVWGQTDSLLNLLFLFGFWKFYNKKYFWGWLGVLGSLYFKLSLIIWLPVVALLFWSNKEDWQKAIKTFLLSAGIFLVCSVPFVHHGNIFTWLWYLYTNRVLPRQGNMLSGNAFNFWVLIFGLDLGLKEQAVFLGSTAKSFGRFFSLILIGFLGLFTFRLKKRKLADYLWLMILIAFGTFLFLTNIHERYLYPIFPLLAVLVASKKINVKIYWLLTVIHFLNLYTLWWYPMISFLRRLLELADFSLVRLFSICFLGLFVYLTHAFVKRVR